MKDSLIEVRVVPRASKNEVSLEADGKLKVRVNSPPVDGKANKAVIETVARKLGIRKGAVSIESGAHGRNKRIHITGMSAREARERLMKKDWRPTQGERGLLTDTHVHFDALEDPDGAVKNAMKVGVTRMIAVGGSAQGNESAMRMAESYPGVVWSAVGFDRSEAGKLGGRPELPDEMIQQLTDPLNCCVAIGEIGLDFHYEADTAEAQASLMRRQLELAREISKPVIVHTREAEDVTYRELRAHADDWNGDPERIGVIHCFTGNRNFAERLTELGFYISFSGIITFKNAEAIREAVLATPIERLLIETDSPFLAPVPHRGQRNEPALLTHVANKLAELRDMSLDNIAEITSTNAARLFDMSE